MTATAEMTLPAGSEQRSWHQPLVGEAPEWVSSGQCPEALQSLGNCSRRQLLNVCVLAGREQRDLPQVEVHAQVPCLEELSVGDMGPEGGHSGLRGAKPCTLIAAGG